MPKDKQAASSIWSQDYPAKPLPFGVSILLHGALLALIVSAPPVSRMRKEPLKPRTIAPRKVLIWYQFKKELPAVVPTQRIGEGDRPRGLERSLQQPIVAHSPNPVSREQFIWHEAPKLKIERDLQAPNLIVAAPALPRPAPRPKPRAFVAPPQPIPRNPPAALILDAAPEVAVDASREVADAAASLAIVGLRPAERLDGPPPEISNPGQLSRAAAVGAPASGLASTAGLRVPDLTIGPGKTSGAAVGVKGEPEKPSPAGELIYQQTLLGGARTALSAPLRPGSRTVPRHIEAKFRDRSVYTIVIPMPKLPCYTGDWVIWFGEMEAQPGVTPQIQAPLPTRKVDALAAEESPIEGRVQLSAIIRKDGRLEEVTVLRGAQALGGSAMRDLKKWDFRPASRNGAAVDVDVVFDIPFRLSPLAAE